MNSGQAMKLWQLIYFLEEQGFTGIGVSVRDSQRPSAKMYYDVSLELHLREEDAPRKAKPIGEKEK